MTKAEFRKSKEYAELMEKIKKYSPGFIFTIHYGAVRKVSKAKETGLRTLLEDAIRMGYLESISIGYTLDGMIEGQINEETYERTTFGYCYLGELP